MTIGWFPRYSPDGSRLTWERDQYWQAQWVNNTTEIAHNGEVLLIGGERTTFPAANELTAGGGRWAGWRSDRGVYTSWGRADMPLAGCPTLNPDGVFGYVDDRQSTLKYLYWNDEPIALGSITDVRASREAVVWSNHGRTWGLKRDEPEAREIQAAPAEFRPIPIDTPHGPWVLNHTHTGIVLRPFGDTHGYKFDNGGNTYYPDAKFALGSIVAVFTNDRGEQTEHPFDLTAPRVDLSREPPKPELIGPRSDPRPADGKLYDLLHYFIGVPTLWPRRGPTHTLGQVVNGKLFYYVKFAGNEPDAAQGQCHEAWGYDENYLYQLYDRSNGPALCLSDPRMYPRQMPIGEVFDPGLHELIRRGTDCRETQAREPFGRRMWLQAVYERFYCGPDLGVRPVMVLAYDPTGGIHAPGRNLELGFYALGAGSFRWESHVSHVVFSHTPAKFDASSLVFVSEFHLLGGPNPNPQILTCIPQVVPSYPPWKSKPDPKEEPMKNKDQVRADINELIRFYDAPDGLNRAARGIPTPIVFNDPAITDWFTLAVMQPVEDVKRQIKQFPEYKEQHKEEP